MRTYNHVQLLGTLNTFPCNASQRTFLSKKWLWNVVYMFVFLFRFQCAWLRDITSLQCRHNERDGVSNHQPYDCLPKRLFRHRSKEASKLRVAGLCEGNSPVTGEFPAQRASNAENVSTWWRHRVNKRWDIVNSSLPGQSGRSFIDDTFKYIFLDENVCFISKFHWSSFLRVQLTICRHWFR